MMRINEDEKRTAKNTIMLYVMAVAKLIFPLLTLPYLTRVLSEESYGLVTYVKACMTYMQLIIDFGFILSSVKDIVNAEGDKEKIGSIVGHTFLAKTLLVGVSFITMLVLCAAIPILRGNTLFALLYFVSVSLTAYIADFLFRGIEKMQIITIIYLISKSISTAATFIFVHGDPDILMIPVLEIVANSVTVILGFYFGRAFGIRIRIQSIKVCFSMLRESFTYFISSMATTVFSALNTVLIGVVITDLRLIAYWGVCTQIISAIQGLYAPITNGVYPHMIRKRSLRFIHKILALIMPVVIAGCVLCFFLAKTALLIVGGEDYVGAYKLFRCLIPILLFSFPAQLYGWPTLGAVGLVKQTTLSTVISACLQVGGLVLLIVTGTMTLYSIAALKCLVEFSFMIIRMYFTYKNRDMFAADKGGML